MTNNLNSKDQVSGANSSVATEKERTYDKILSDINDLKKQFITELKYSSLQTSSIYQTMKDDIQKSLDNSLQENKQAFEKISAEIDKLKDPSTLALINGGKKQENVDYSQEARYMYQQNQLIYESLSSMLNDVISAIENVQNSVAVLSNVEKSVSELQGKNEENNFDVDAISETLKEKIAKLLKTSADPFAETVAQKIQTVPQTTAVIDSSVPLNVEQLSDIVKEKVIGAIPLPEEVDYERIIDTLAEKNELSVATHNKEVLDGIAMIPVAENIDYQRIVEEVSDVVLEKVQEVLENFKSAFAQTETNIDYDKIIYGTTEKVIESLPYADKVDYGRIENIFMKTTDIDYDLLAEKIAGKMAKPTEIDYDLLAEKVAEKINLQTVNTNFVVVDNQPEPTEEPLEVIEEPVEEVVEPIKEVEEPIDEVEETEIAVAMDEDGELVDRLKKSFTAKLCQSEEYVKAYYSDIKNKLLSYKKVRSNVSFHGDRYNVGRKTLAKITIIGKTLCLYLALDPNSENYATNIYHQKDVSNVKANEGTPFMVKVRSDLGNKRALVLIDSLMTENEGELDEKFENKDYALEFKYATTEELIEKDLIKVTREKNNFGDFSKNSEA